MTERALPQDRARRHGTQAVVYMHTANLPLRTNVAGVGVLDDPRACRTRSRVADISPVRGIAFNKGDKGLGVLSASCAQPYNDRV